MTRDEFIQKSFENLEHCGLIVRKGTNEKGEPLYALAPNHEELARTKCKKCNDPICNASLDN